jgi:outer membrane protein
MQGGIGTLVEVLETAARAESLTGQVRGAEGAEKILLAELARLAAMPVAAVRGMKDESPELVVPNNPEAALVLARSNSATLMRLQKALESARANVEAQRGAYLPSVDLVANLNQSRSQFDGSSSLTPSAGVGVRLSVPLYSGGVTDSRVREAHAQVERAEEDLKDAHNTLQSEMMKAYADLERGQSQLAANVAALGVSQSALDATVKAFNAGVRSNIDVLNVQQQAFSIRRETERSRVAIQLAQNRILSLAGTLNLTSIARLALSLAEVK